MILGFGILSLLILGIVTFVISLRIGSDIQHISQEDMLQLAQTKADVLNRQIEKLQWELKILASTNMENPVTNMDVELQRIRSFLSSEVLGVFYTALDGSTVTDLRATYMANQSGYNKNNPGFRFYC